MKAFDLRLKSVNSIFQEMIIDKYKGKNIPNYLISDVVMYDGKNVNTLPFYPDRCNIINQKIMAGRATVDVSLMERETFSVRQKHMWDIKNTSKLLSEKFIKQLSHQMDGLIFRPDNASYCTGRTCEVLRWKPLLSNFVNFRLKIIMDIGYLFTSGSKMPYDTIKIDKQLKKLDNAIIECKFENDQWIFIRQRVNSSCADSLEVANLIFVNSLQSIPTKEKLLKYIDTECTFVDQNDNDRAYSL